jgi:hypothetical protein
VGCQKLPKSLQLLSEILSLLNHLPQLPKILEQRPAIVVVPISKIDSRLREIWRDKLTGNFGDNSSIPNSLNELLSQPTITVFPTKTSIKSQKSAYGKNVQRTNFVA